jgi:hypothetical protein
MPKRSPTPTGWPSLTKQTMRRATSPAICVTAMRGPAVVAMTSELRSLCTLALSRSALKNLPGV